MAMCCLLLIYILLYYTFDSTVSNDVYACIKPSSLDILILVDSSGSVYDSEYQNWEAELSLAQSITESSFLPFFTTK